MRRVTSTWFVRKNLLIYTSNLIFFLLIYLFTYSITLVIMLFESMYFKIYIYVIDTTQYIVYEL